MTEDAQECKDCNGKGYFDRNHLGKTPTSCQTCEGDGYKYRAGPYRLADGTWSDGVDRVECIKLHKFHIENPSRPIVIQTWDQRPDGGYDWVAIESKYGEPEYFPTHAEAIAYADKQARTTNQGEN
ncbi:hypothetical protein [Glutamicibacter sp. AOP5-A2-18]|uniref:hypothetical protein n=1 Tax=Glutamicibacter sp. AOP5-A2-18 TaxID=3457656 RepID=UPI0040342E58